MRLILDKPNKTHLYSFACSPISYVSFYSLFFRFFPTGLGWRCLKIRYRRTTKWCGYDRFSLYGLEAGRVEEKEKHQVGSDAGFSQPQHKLFTVSGTGLCVETWMGECAGFIYPPEPPGFFCQQSIVKASLGHGWPHARQEQEAVPHSANTAHCCLSFSAGLASQKTPRHGGVTVSHTGLLTVSPTCTITQLLSFPKQQTCM